MKQYILAERPLNDDILYLADEGKVFKGDYIAFIEMYTFENTWADEVKFKRFRTKNSLDKFLKKNYPNFNYYA